MNVPEEDGKREVILYAIWRKSGTQTESATGDTARTAKVEPTEYVRVSAIPNQIFSRTYRGITYEFHLRPFNGMMFADISVNGEVVANGVRCVPGAWLIPNYAAAASGSGNFKFTTLGDAYPWYEDFGGSCKLEFYDEAAYLAAQSE